MDGVHETGGSGQATAEMKYCTWHVGPTLLHRPEVMLPVSNCREYSAKGKADIGRTASARILFFIKGLYHCTPLPAKDSDLPNNRTSC
jgi:hypothetical protein